MTSPGHTLRRCIAGLKGLRVAVVSDAAPERNGVGAYYRDLLDGLQDKAAAVGMFSPRIEDGQWVSDLVLPMPGDATQKLCFPNPFALQRALGDMAPDAVIVPTPGVYGMTGAYFALRRQIPVIAGFHTSFEQLTDLYWQGSLKGRFYTWYLSRSHRFLFARSALVLVNSDDMKDLALRMGAGAKVRRVATPLPAAFAREPVRPYDGHVRRILFAGRLAAEKNIEAVLDLATRMPDVDVSVVGDGPQRALVADAADTLANLHFLGWLDRDGLRDEIDRHDLLVLPSHFESFGTIALEAMSRQRPVIVSNGAGISNWSSLTPGLVVLGDHEDLAAGVQRVRRMEPSQRVQLACRARSLAMAFNEKNLSDWADVLTSVTG